MRRTSVVLALAALVLMAALPGTSEGNKGKGVDSIVIRAGTGAPPLFNVGLNDGFSPPEIIIVKKDGSIYMPHSQGRISPPGPGAAKSTALLAPSSWGKIKGEFGGEAAFPLAAGGVRLAKKGGGGGKPGDGGSPAAALLDLEEGLITAGLQVNLGSDSDRKLHLDTHAFSGTMDFADPGDWFQIKGNSKQPDITQEEGEALLAELGPGNVVDNGSFFMEINKVGLQPGGATSGGHFLTFDYVGALGETRVLIGEPYFSVTVAWISHTETVDVFQFTGTVIVGTLGSRKNSRIIGCPGVGPDPNKVVVTVSR